MVVCDFAIKRMLVFHFSEGKVSVFGGVSSTEGEFYFDSAARIGG